MPCNATTAAQEEHARRHATQHACHRGREKGGSCVRATKRATKCRQRRPYIRTDRERGEGMASKKLLRARAMPQNALLFSNYASQMSMRRVSGFHARAMHVLVQQFSARAKRPARKMVLLMLSSSPVSLFAIKSYCPPAQTCLFLSSVPPAGRCPCPCRLSSPCRRLVCPSVPPNLSCHPVRFFFSFHFLFPEKVPATRNNVQGKVTQRRANEKGTDQIGEYS